MAGNVFSLDRVLHTVPELDKADKRSGATFVNILFGLVVTTAAISFSTELVKWWAEAWDAVNKPRLSHLLVAMALTVLSWIGYHQSQQYPPFLIKFLNIPFFQFVLDVSMVIVYYTAVAVAEGSHPALSEDALPEAILVLLVFLLYSAWDLLGFLLFRDPEYAKRLQTPRQPERRIGRRRSVTLWFTLAVGVLALVIWRLNPNTPLSVTVADAAIIAILFLYRVAKQASDPKVKTRPRAA